MIRVIGWFLSALEAEEAKSGFVQSLKQGMFVWLQAES
jgi:hypothetical protein